MKRFFAFLLAMTLIFSLGITAHAAVVYSSVNKTEEIIKTGGGTITITNATKDAEYTVYKLFNATPNMVDKVVDGVTVQVMDGIVYSLEPSSDAYKALFGTGIPDNEFFDYNTSTHAVTRKATKTVDKELIDYLEDVVAANPNAFPFVKQTAAGKNLLFDELVHGYYLIKSGLGTVVTIDSNTPTVEVIDKNQVPGTKFDKQVSIKDADKFGDSNTANIGDLVTYRITFDATNYTGDQQINYYQVFDIKGDAIWAEFDSFRVYIDGVPLKNGHYMNHGGVNTGPWSAIGPWDTGIDKNLANADWYLVHKDFDEYSILIPWRENHVVTGSEPTQEIDYLAESASKFNANVTVTIEYDAVIEPNANVGGNADNLFNEATLKWFTEHDSNSTKPDRVTTTTYGIGIVKENTEHHNLAGAKFRVWKNYDSVAKTYSGEVFVIPTGIDGVYMVDSKGTPGEHTSGTHQLNAREYFEYLRKPDGSQIGSDLTPPVLVKNEALVALGDTQTNVVESQVNGKLVILGLAMGTYYLEEFEAPAGYNAMNTPVTLAITVDSSHSFDIFAEADGDVADVLAAGSQYTKYDYFVTQQVVQNSKGHELPATGGEGTVMMITIGTMVAMAFAVLMITQKKMSVYHD